MGGDPLDLITEGREKLAAEDRAAWSSAALSDRMLAVAAERERLDAEFLRLTAEWDARGAWGDDGFASASAWLAANARMPRAAAGRVLRSARHVQRFAATGKALAEGTGTAEKVDALAESARHREEFYERDEALLLDIAARLDTRDLTLALRTWRNLADDDLLEPPDRVGGPDTPRTVSQRRGEGLVKLARHYLDGRTGADGGGRGRAMPTIEVVFTPQHDPRDLEGHRGEISGFGSVPLDTIRRLACDARIGWLVMNGEREVLDIGRSVRTPSAGQRRAVAVRDRHCRYPGCRAAAEWCDVHHLVEWERGGATDLANLVLLCRRDHQRVHEGRRRLVRDPDGNIRLERRATTVRSASAGEPRARGPSG